MLGKRHILPRIKRPSQARSLVRTAAPAAILCAVLGLVAGCETVAPDDSGRDAAYLEQRAARMAAAGRHEGAASLYEQLAERAENPARYRLAAARSWRQAGQWRQVLSNITRIEAASLNAGAATERSLLGADAELALDDADAAQGWLDLLPEQLSESAMPPVLWLRVRLALARGDVSSAAALALEREVWLARPDEIMASRRAFLDLLRGQALDGLLPDDTAVADELAGGWIALARRMNQADRDPFAVRAALRDWQVAYADHPGRMLLPGLMALYQSMLDYPAQIAVILPLSGRLQSAGQAVRDGIAAAYLKHQDARPVIRFHDSGAGAIADVYAQAVLDGADFVIGPLTRPAVSELVQSGQLPVPTLALNNLPAEMQAPPGLFQFALSPEDEARQAARRVVEDGLVQGIALVPATEWGRRMLAAFTEELEANGGTLLDYADFSPREEDYSGAITTVLHLAESRRRYLSLAGVLGRRLEFEPRRRQDAQFVFLAASAESGRLMRPQLRFHYASDLPVYATSAIYEPEPERNGDLNGIMFTDSPWSIDDNEDIEAFRTELRELWPDGMRTWPRLYALGFDAYRLVPALFGGGLSPENPVKGLSGDLFAGPGGQIRRGLMWAKFEDGRPALMQDAAVLRQGQDELPPAL